MDLDHRRTDGPGPRTNGRTDERADHRRTVSDKQRDGRTWTPDRQMDPVHERTCSADRRTWTTDRQMDGRTSGRTADRQTDLDRRRVGDDILPCQVSLLLPLPELPEVILDQERCIKLADCHFLL